MILSKVCHAIGNVHLSMPLCFITQHAIKIYLWIMDI